MWFSKKSFILHHHVQSSARRWLWSAGQRGWHANSFKSHLFWKPVELLVHILCKTDFIVPLPKTYTPILSVKCYNILPKTSFTAQNIPYTQHSKYPSTLRSSRWVCFVLSLLSAALVYKNTFHWKKYWMNFRDCGDTAGKNLYWCIWKQHRQKFKWHGCEIFKVWNI